MQTFNKISKSLNIDAKAVSNLGSILTGADGMAYEGFASRFNTSAISGANQDPQQLQGVEVDNVLAGLGEGVSAVLAKLVNERITAGALDSSQWVAVTYGTPVTTGFGSTKTETHTFVVDDIAEMGDNGARKCSGGATSCDIHLKMNIQLVFTGGTPKGAEATTPEGKVQTMNLPNFSLNVVSLSAYNDYVKVDVTPGMGALTGTLDLTLQKEGTVILGAEITATKLTTNLDAKISDRMRVGTSLNAKVQASLPELVANVSLDSKMPTKVDLLYMVTSTLKADLTILDGEDLLTGTVNATANVVGMAAPFTYIFESKVKREGENAQNFLKLEGNASYQAKVNGNKLLDASLAGDRLTHELNQVNPLQVTYGGRTYSFNNQIDWDGKLVSMNAIDPVSGVKITVSKVAGVRSGTVVNAKGEKIGTIKETDDQRLLITYVDGSTQYL